MGAFAKGAGKGSRPADGFQSGCPMQTNPLEGLLGVLSGVERYEKGGPATSMTPPSAAAADAEQPNAPAAESRRIFDESVEDLLNMGLIADRQMARELLTQHGDVSAVVAAL